MKLHKLPLGHIMAVLFSVTSIAAVAQSQVQPVSLAGNAYVTQRADKVRISENGADNWSSPQTTSVHIFMSTSHRPSRCHFKARVTPPCV